ncbi:hypothetical protein HPB51_021104 [Rhipicephalus microplus]|uniref:Uncharacterized protein n=1 Tax=Rhipicephalus microplus TaxID=6941 RepID=A0A9J6E4F2_RHIMP|nr:hypothetical protein HPB51_021104 [Rhipicephalus microplus]
MAESHPSKKFLLRLGFPKRATVCFNVARGFVPPCNLSTTGICCLMDVVANCNKALWCLGLQIRDDARDEVGEVGVAIIRSLGRGYLAAFLKSDPGLLALAVLFFLFEEHNCIVAVELFDVIAKNRAVLFSLRKIPALKRLAIVVDLDEQPEGVGGLVEFVQSVVVADGVQLKFIDRQLQPGLPNVTSSQRPETSRFQD